MNPRILSFSFSVVFALLSIETRAQALRNGALEISRRPNTTIKLTPIYADTFNGGRLGTIRFHRNVSGAVTEFSVVQYRVWDLRFRK